VYESVNGLELVYKLVTLCGSVQAFVRLVSAEHMVDCSRAHHNTNRAASITKPLISYLRLHSPRMSLYRASTKKLSSEARSTKCSAKSKYPSIEERECRSMEIAFLLIRSRQPRFQKRITDLSLVNSVSCQTLHANHLSGGRGDSNRLSQGVKREAWQVNHARR
jgi:hypothetical protein